MASIRLLGPCNEPRCAGRATHDGYCVQHRRTTTQRGYGSAHQRERERALTADSVCALCGSRDRLRRDHIVPRSLGGSNDSSNLRWLCASCHARHGDQSNRGRPQGGIQSLERPTPLLTPAPRNLSVRVGGFD